MVREERTPDLFLAGRVGGRGDDRDAMLGSEGGETPEVGDDRFGAGNIEFADRVHEVELRVDVPEEEARQHGRDLVGAALGHRPGRCLGICPGFLGVGETGALKRAL